MLVNGDYDDDDDDDCGDNDVDDDDDDDAEDDCRAGQCWQWKRRGSPAGRLQRGPLGDDGGDDDAGGDYGDNDDDDDGDDDDEDEAGVACWPDYKEALRLGLRSTYPHNIQCIAWVTQHCTNTVHWTSILYIALVFRLLDSGLVRSTQPP